MAVIPPSPTRAELARELIRYKMMEYSQDFACATWLVDLEFDLWNAADKPDPDGRRGYEIALGRELRNLAEIADGWWVYEDATRPGMDAPVFIPLDRWHQILAQHRDSSTP